MADTACKPWLWLDFWIGQKSCKMVFGNKRLNPLMLLPCIVHTDFSFSCSLHRKNLEAELMIYLPMKLYYSGVSIKLPAIPMWMWRTSPKAGVMGWPSMRSYMLTGKIWMDPFRRSCSLMFLALEQVVPGTELQVSVKKPSHSLFALSHCRIFFLNWISFHWGRKDQKLLLGSSFSWAWNWISKGISHIWATMPIICSQPLNQVPIALFPELLF